MSTFQDKAVYLNLEDINTEYSTDIATELEFLKNKIQNTLLENEGDLPVPLVYKTSKPFPVLWPRSESVKYIAKRPMRLEYFRSFSKTVFAADGDSEDGLVTQTIPAEISEMHETVQELEDYQNHFRAPHYMLVLGTSGSKISRRELNYFKWNLKNSFREYSRYMEIVLVFNTFEYKLGSRLKYLQGLTSSILPNNWVRIGLGILSNLIFALKNDLSPKTPLSLDSFGMEAIYDHDFEGGIYIIEAPDVVKRYSLKFADMYNFKKVKKGEAKINSVDLALEMMDFLTKFRPKVDRVHGKRERDKMPLTQFVQSFIETTQEINLKDFSDFNMKEISVLFAEYQNNFNIIFDYLENLIHLKSLVNILEEGLVRTTLLKVEKNEYVLMQLIIFMSFERTRNDALLMFKNLVFESHIDVIMDDFMTKSVLMMDEFLAEARSVLRGVYEEARMDDVKQIFYQMARVRSNLSSSVFLLKKILFNIKDLNFRHLKSVQYYSSYLTGRNRDIMINFKIEWKELRKTDGARFVQAIKNCKLSLDLYPTVMTLVHNKQTLL